MNKVVMEVAQINLRGILMDQGWFQHITLANGKPYVVAITLLSEIMYWYKPTEVKDELTNQVTYKQKFKADKLQKSYQQLADTFGFTKRQVLDACKYLKDKGYITIEFRTVIVKGVRCNNVMYVEPVPSAVRKISTLYLQNETPPPSESESLPRSNETPSHDITGEPPTLERETNTEITTKTTTKITTDIKSKKNSPDIRPSTPAPTGQSSTSSIDKPKEKNTIPFAEIVNYLNEQAITDYKATSKEIQRLIRARWKDGYRVEDFKKVIDTKVAEWLNDPKMNMYLRPSTLFGAKFTDYHGQRPVRKGVVKHATPQQQHSRYAGDNDVKLPF